MSAPFISLHQTTKSYYYDCMKWWFQCMKYGADHMACPTLLNPIRNDYLNSSQLLMGMSPAESEQKALMNASAKRALVSKGMLRSTAARRIL